MEDTIIMELSPEEALLIKTCRQNRLLWKAVYNFFKKMAGIE